jgi:8-oxo-dGTP pyrophosphatase MutT (NUDIX family)
MTYAGAGFILLSSDLSTTLLVHDTRSQKWGFPKGHKEPTDASDLETAVRECFEETGLTTEDYSVHPDVFKVSKGSQSYNFRYAILRDETKKKNIVPGNIQEVKELQWVPLKQLLDASNILDGNKYLRTWISDIQSNASKKSIHIFKTLIRKHYVVQYPNSGLFASLLDLCGF